MLHRTARRTGYPRSASPRTGYLSGLNRDAQGRVQEVRLPHDNVYSEPAEGDYVSVEMLLSMVTGASKMEPPTQQPASSSSDVVVVEENAASVEAPDLGELEALRRVDPHEHRLPATENNWMDETHELVDEAGLD